MSTRCWSSAGSRDEERARIERQAREAAEGGVRERADPRRRRCSPASPAAPGVVLTTKDDMRLQHIEFVRVEPEKALAVLVAEDGAVENRIVAIPRRYLPPPR